ncbi:hypothetical protein [Streptomyces sp. NPDC127197]|uniref:hypothetical protein n=1 Tax=Streptomyces sp. NPDC127197 TaxID=3345388 RepID=UPI00362A52CB
MLNGNVGRVQGPIAGELVAVQQHGLFSPAAASFRTARTPLRHGVTSCSAGRTRELTDPNIEPCQFCRPDTVLGIDVA